MELPVLEISDSVVFPGMTVSFGLVEGRHRQLIKQVLRQEEHRFLVSWSGEPPAAGDPDRLQSYGTNMAVLKVAGNDQSGYTVTAQGLGRQLIKVARTESHLDSDGGHSSLVFAHDEPAPLERHDPNEELLEAWDTVTVFQRYAGRFFDERLKDQIDEALPDDPFYIASFICANTRLEPQQQQLLLAAPSLIARLRLVRAQMHEQLGESGAPEL